MPALVFLKKPDGLRVFRIKDSTRVSMRTESYNNVIQIKGPCYSKAESPHCIINMEKDSLPYHSFLLKGLSTVTVFIVLIHIRKRRSFN